MVIFFDGDRTLWHPVYDYQDCFTEFKEWLFDKHSIDFPIDVIATSINAYIKYENNRGNHDRSVFPLCVMRAFNAIYLNERETTPTVEQLAEAFRIGDRLYDKDPELYPETIDILNKVKEDISKNIYLLTAGDKQIQQSKIFSTNIKDEFKETYIVDHKVDTVYYILKQNMGIKYPGQVCVMIGDNIKHDINPAISIGWYAIYVKTGLEQPKETKNKRAYAKDELVENPRVYIADSLNDVPGILLEIKNNLMYDGDINDNKV